VLSEYPDNGYLEVVDTIAPIAADRRNLGEQTASFLASGLPERKLIPAARSRQVWKERGIARETSDQITARGDRSRRPVGGGLAGHGRRVERTR
jgi:hypothetical protein